MGDIVLNDTGKKTVWKEKVLLVWTGQISDAKIRLCYNFI